MLTLIWIDNFFYLWTKKQWTAWQDIPNITATKRKE